MLIMLTPSLPKRANTTTTTPPVFTPIATQRSLLLRDGAVEKRLVEIGEIQPMLVEICEPLRFIPNDFHYLM